jgi:hypothetical protein
VRALALAACAGAIGARPGPAAASLLFALDAPTLVERADAIAVVDVARADAAWDEAGERIVTTVELVVVESWKGAMEPAARVRVLQPGGTAGDVTMTVFGMPRFSAGERALVFLRGGRERAALVGMTQGKRRLRHDPVSRRILVDPADGAGATFLRRGPFGAGAAPGGRSFGALDADGPRPLDDVRAEIRALVARGAR